MLYNFDGYNYAVRLERGERLVTAIEQFVVAAKIEGAWLSGLGAASEIELGFYNLGSKAYKWRTYAQMMEVVSLTGNIAFEESEKIIIHLHGVFADDEYQVVGGHVRDLVVGGTLELFVHRSYQLLLRRHDETTGLELFNFS